MIFGLFKRNPNRQVIDRLHGEIMAAARQPALFIDYGVADTVDGRFEVLTLLATIVVRALTRLEAPGPELAQQLTDAIFAHFDVAMRESGVSDVGVPKRMKKLAQGYLGRSASYRTALDRADQAELATAISRNVFGGESPHAADLAKYAMLCQSSLEKAGREAYLSGPLPFPPVPGLQENA